MSEQEPILELCRGEILLAVLSNIQLYDWPWYKCHFRATSAFESYRPLFDEELKLLDDKGADEAWFTAYQRIEDLGLILSYPAQAKSTDLFFLHLEGETARFKADFA